MAREGVVGEGSMVKGVTMRWELTGQYVKDLKRWRSDVLT
jgi:hypothetical protein